MAKRKDTRVRLGRYSAVNIPTPLCSELDEIVKREGIYGSRAKLVVKLIQDFIERYRHDQILKHEIEKKTKKKIY